MDGFMVFILYYRYKLFFFITWSLRWKLNLVSSRSQAHTGPSVLVLAYSR